MPATISFGFACLPDDAGIFGCALAYFMFYPYWLAVFNWLVGLVDNRRYFFLASWILLTAGFYYMESFAEALQYERPEHYDSDLCRTKRYAIPDAKFVSSIAYTIVAAFGLVRDHRRFGALNAIVAYSTPVLYVAATIYTGYLSAAQVAINLVISLVTAAMFVAVFQLATASA